MFASFTISATSVKSCTSLTDVDEAARHLGRGQIAIVLGIDLLGEGFELLLDDLEINGHVLCRAKDLWERVDV